MPNIHEQPAEAYAITDGERLEITNALDKLNDAVLEAAILRGWIGRMVKAAQNGDRVSYALLTETKETQIELLSALIELDLPSNLGFPTDDNSDIIK